MIYEYEVEFVEYLLKRIKYDELEIPEGFECIGDVPKSDFPYKY